VAVFTAGDEIAGRYEVIKQLGRGGMGVVYLVRDSKAGGHLALKTLLPEYVTNVRAVQRFMREVEAVQQLDHPCIVKIFDVRQVGETLFYTMEYVEGQSLRSLMRKRKTFGIGSTVRILSLLCYALEHAHQFTIHRDISPENVIVTAEGKIRLLDFGLAKVLNSDVTFTRIGVSLGKIQYGAPEQRADAANVDHRADLYSLGVMFYEMLSGQLPKPGQSLTSLVPTLPAEFDAFAEKAMAINPEERYASARDFRVALIQLYEQSRRPAAPPIPVPPPPRAWLRRLILRLRRRRPIL
jgi:serine/threonine protein kinase